MFLDIETIVNYRVDRFQHLLGGVFVGLSSAGLIWQLTYRKYLVQPSRFVLRVIVVGMVCFAAICWETLEYFLQLHPQYLTYTDTILDLNLGLLGGLTAATMIRFPKRIVVKK
jgi:hypothetical protein